MRLTLAQKAFRLTASYDAAVSNWMQGQGSEDLAVVSAPERFTMSGKLVQELRYGENPHQQAAAYKSTNPDAPKGVMSAQQIQGKALSYNNFNDADAALRLVREFVDPACVIVKHANPVVLRWVMICTRPIKPQSPVIPSVLLGGNCGEPPLGRRGCHCHH